MKKALVFLLACAGLVSGQPVLRDIYIRGDFFELTRNEPWTGTTNDYRMRSYTPAGKVCLSIFNHQPAVAHTISGPALGAGDVILAGIASVWKPLQMKGSGGVAFDGTVATVNKMVATVAPIGIEQIEIDARGMALFRVSLTPDGVVSPAPNTFSITGVMGSCGFREGGRIASLFSANPAANTEITVTVPAYATWRVMGATATLVTAVAAGNRLVTLIVDDGANELFRVNAAVVQAPSLTYSYSFASAVSDTVVPGNVVKLPQLLVKSGWRIRTLTTNLAAADDWSAMRLLVEEWVQ